MMLEAEQEAQDAADDCSDILRDIPVPNIVGFGGSDAIYLAKEASRPRPPSPGSMGSDSTPMAELPELTGIGSAYERASARRQDSIREEDLGVPAPNAVAAATTSTTDDAKE